MPIFCRQLRLRTDSSKSVTGMLEHLAQPILAATGVFVVVHVARGVGVLEEQPGPAVIREHVENPLVTLPRLVVVLHVFVQHAEVEQRADVGRKLRGGPLVKLAGVAVVAVAIVFQRQAEQRAGVTPVGRDGSLQESDDFVRIAAHGRNRRGTLIQIFGRLLDGAREPVERGHRCLRAAGVALGLGLRERDGVATVAGLFGRLVSGQRVLIAIECQVGLAQIDSW